MRVARSFLPVGFSALVLLTTPGCISFLAGLSCAANGGCGSETMSSAMQADIQIGGLMVEGAIEAAQRTEPEAEPPADPASAGAEVLEQPYSEAPPVPAPTTPGLAGRDVEIFVVGADADRVRVFDRSSGKPHGALVAECGPPCTLSLAPSRYAFSLGGLSMMTEVEIAPYAPPRAVRLDVRSHEDLRTAGWSMVGASVAGTVGFGIAAGMAGIEEPEIVVPSVTGVLAAVLVVGFVLGLWPDEVSGHLQF
jgi:hypothetical protein